MNVSSKEDIKNNSGLVTRYNNGHPVVYLNNKPFFYFGGELEYYRVPIEDWKDRLSKIKEAGCNSVSTYIPWNWHEYEEGRFDFKGETYPSRNLERFLEICEELKLFVIVRPGPWICNEWKFGGVPAWFLKKYWPEVASLNNKDQPITGGFKTGSYETDTYPAVCYFHPRYMEYVKIWYDEVCRVIKKHLIVDGGCIVAVSVDNEESFMFNQGIFEADYNPIVVGKYEERYHAPPPRSWPVPDPKNMGKLVDVMRWIRFKDSYLAEFLSWLKALLFDREIYSVPVVSNDGVRDLRVIPSINLNEKEKYGVWIWGDYYPQIVSSGRTASLFLDAKAMLLWSLYGTEVLKATQPNKPAMSMEFQGGWSCKPPFVKASDTRLLTYHAIGHDLKGINYFMIADGINPIGYGLPLHTGVYYDLSSALNTDGEPTDRYYAIQRIGKFIKDSGERLANAHKISDVTVAYYHPHYSSPPDSQGYGFKFDLRMLLENEFFGLMRLLTMSGVNFNLLDIEHADINQLLLHKAIIHLSFDFMDKETQSKLVEYVYRGGTLILYPSKPTLDEELKKINKFDKLFQAPMKGVVEGEIQELILGDMPTAALFKTYEFDMRDLAVQPIAWNARGEVIGYMSKYGEGRAILLGTCFASWTINEEIAKKMTTVQKETSKGIIFFLLGQAGIRRQAYASNLDVEVVEQVANEDTYGFVFLTNLNDSSKTIVLNVTDPKSGKQIVIPKITEITIPGRMSYVFNLNRAILGFEAEILYTTSEIVSIQTKNSKIVVEVWAKEMGKGELAMVINKKPQGIFIDDVPVKYTWNESTKKVCLVYNQGPHSIEIDC